MTEDTLAAARAEYKRAAAAATETLRVCDAILEGDLDVNDLSESEFDTHLQALARLRAAMARLNAVN